MFLMFMLKILALSCLGFGLLFISGLTALRVASKSNKITSLIIFFDLAILALVIVLHATTILFPPGI